ncbi:HutP family protein [Cetobacterium sp.]|uniref:HutP family protein n=1 Tax=Cetobacterium sp. TaxID=2071632 RepID=UPI003EE56DBA
MNIKSSENQKNVSSVGHKALLLALTRTIDEENELKKRYKAEEIRFVVTEIGGKSSGGELQEKINKSVIGACLNEKLIEKNGPNLHAVLHATEEAKKCILMNTTSTASVVLKIAIVRDEHWIAVAMFGESSIHPLTGHERCGLGIMHI